ncbi:MAG TPA: protein kinase, partial [Longimicrobiales bacterium]|nr:protein kinase [Longimicrobiales bacterium]
MSREAHPPPPSCGKYQITELIGEGGFGRVFKGWDPGLKRPVAIKTCSLSDADMRERFIREAEIAASLRHTNITMVYDFGEEAGEPYLVQEYLTGEDLGHVIARRDPVPLGTRIRYLVQVAEGLGHAHARGVVHRDVKPANMRVLEDGQVRIMDFGIAKLVEETQRLTQVGMTLGTAGYLSPEQLLGLEVDARADIFSFGIMAYELVTYRRPFEADSVSALFYAIAHQDPPPLPEVWPACPRELSACITRCLEKDRERRYQDMGEVARDLGRVLAGLEAEGGLPTVVAPFFGGLPSLSGDPTIRYVARGPDAGAPEHHAQPPGAPSDRARRPMGRRLRPYLGLGAAAAVVAALGILGLARWGASVPQPDPTRTEGRGTEGAGSSTDTTTPFGASAGQRGDTAGSSEVIPTRSGTPESPAGAQPSSTSPGTSRTTPTSPQGAAPYRGTSILLLVWSEGGDPSAAATAETALLDELRSRGLAVAEPATLQLLSRDPAARPQGSPTGAQPSSTSPGTSRTTPT